MTHDPDHPELALGCAAIGRAAVDDDTAAATVRAALAGGITVFDTAPHYGAGRSERRLGEVLRDGDRSRLVISTKVGRTIVGDRTEIDHSYDGAWRSLEGSLTRLGIDRVDVLHAHDPVNVQAAVGGEFKALAEMRDQGLTRAIGCGMNHTEPLSAYLRETVLDVVMVAGHLNLLDHAAADRLLPDARARGADVWIAGVYATGILATASPEATYGYRPAPPEVVSRVGDIDAVCRRHGTDLAAAAVHHPWRFGVARLVVGAKDPDEVDTLIAAARTRVPGALWDELRERRLVVAP